MFYSLLLPFALLLTTLGIALLVVAALATLPFTRTRRGAPELGVVAVVVGLAIAYGLSSGAAPALANQTGVGSTPSEACRALAESARRAGVSQGQDLATGQPPAYVAAVEAYLALGCGGAGRDVTAMAPAEHPNS